MNNKWKNKNYETSKKKTYMSYHQDGLLDIFIGTYIIIIGLSIFTLTILEYSTWFLMPAIFPAIMIPIWMSAKKKITMPRIGYVNIGNKGSNKLMSLFLGLLGVGLGMFFFRCLLVFVLSFVIHLLSISNLAV